MTTITKPLVLLLLCLVVSIASAQDSIQKVEKNTRIEKLLQSKESIKTQERELLKQEVEAINKRLDDGEITPEEADTLKTEAAKRRALNIENKLAILDNKIALLERNEEEYVESIDTVTQIGISLGKFTGITIRNKEKKYDKRTTSDLVFAAGFNNTLSKGRELGDTYTFMESGFIELGWAWKTRVFENSNALRLKYGFSFQWNKFTPKGDKYFVQNGNITTLEEFPSNLTESEFRVTNLVFPVHFEFGPSKKIDKGNYFRYTTRSHFKVGIGGYAGFNIGTQQKLRFKEDGDRVKQKIRRSYNASTFVYGLSGYIGYGSMGIYVKYDLNPLFKDQAFDQNNFSIGLRFDLD